LSDVNMDVLKDLIVKTYRVEKTRVKIQ
jgi:hypothetical protein